MQTAYVLKGHLSDDRTIVLNEPTSLPPGPVIVTVLPEEQLLSTTSGYSDEERAELWKRIDAITSLTDPIPPADGLSAKYADALLYGQDTSTNNVL